jgi:hypothetical protein
MVMLKLFDRVRLVRDLDATAPVGAAGVVVDVLDGGYNVEVFDEDGETIDVFGARDADLEPVTTDGSAAA